MNKLLQILMWAAVVTACICPLSQTNMLSCSQAVADTDGTPLAADVNDRAEQESAKDPDQEPLGAQVKIAAVKLLAKLGVNAEAAKLYALWIVGAPTLVLFILIGMLLRPRKEKALPRRTQPPKYDPSRSKGVTTKNLTPMGSESMPVTDKEQVLKFFFKLFKQQVGADPNAPTQLTLIESRPTCPNETYEMRVMHNNEWDTRRMSIGLLGQGGGSRSKCYYVIYDSHLVLKIPSVPIPGFTAYHQQIAAEARIVARLSPRQCIVPRVAVILKAVHSIAGGENLSEEELEKKYVHLLGLHPDYQDYLKIGPSFAFFMDLARHFFLSTTLDEMHSGHKRLVNEALKQQDLLWDQHGFVCRYGEDAGSVCHELQEAYYRCEGRLRQLVEEAHLDEDIPTFRLKQWFVTHLAGEKIDPDAQALPEEFIERVNRLLFKVTKDHHQQVERYRQGVRGYIREIQFSQHRVQLESLSTNTLDLLAWIGTKGLALRDLKPENLFVAGNPEAYPLFLNDINKFSIGLIDVETSVVIDADDPDNIPQPQMAGTPLYATPSHLVSNVVLEEVYGDVRTILHLQDWYATIAIIYKIVTGENLFAITARVFPEILKHIKLIDPSGPDLDKDIARINRLFWNSAVAEFQDAMAKHKPTFNRVEVAVPEAILTDIVKILHRGCDELATALANTVSKQSVFTGREKCQFLMDASVEKIQQMKKKLELEQPGGKRAEHRGQALEVLARIETIKSALTRKLEAAAALKSTGAPIWADQLLEAMFQRVYSVMYLPHWPILSPSKWDGKTTLPTDITTYQATM